MIRMINGLTGTIMWVHETRLDEYLSAGHKLALPPVKEQSTEPVKRPPAKQKKVKE